MAERERENKKSLLIKIRIMYNKIFVKKIFIKIMSGNKFRIIIQRAVCCKYFTYIFNLMSRTFFDICGKFQVIKFYYTLFLNLSILLEP